MSLVLNNRALDYKPFNSFSIYTVSETLEAVSIFFLLAVHIQHDIKIISVNHKLVSCDN